MKSTAYLVIHVDATDPKHPSIIGAGIYSQPGISLTRFRRARFNLDLLSASAETFEEARERLLIANIAMLGEFNWAFALVPENERVIEPVEQRKPTDLYTEAWFLSKVGCAPIHDDLERSNCNMAGAQGHTQCGVCTTHDKPRFVCGCALDGR